MIYLHPLLHECVGFLAMFELDIIVGLKSKGPKTESNPFMAKSDRN
jgi:hypothetical protein